MKIIHLEKIIDGINIFLDNGEEAQFYKFGNTIYSVISEGLHKEEFIEFKENITANRWDIEVLRKIWVG